MIKRIMVLWLALSILMLQPSLVLAQEFGNFGNIAERLEIAEKEKVRPPEEGYKKFTCPTCRRDFEIRVDPNDLELNKGIKKIVCPYDGTVFYPEVSIEEAKPQYEEMRCPHCGKRFKGYVNVKAILAGQSQMIICPYDKKKFYFKAEGFVPLRVQWANLKTVICPTDKRTFKAYIDPKNPKELTCPYDRTRFFPTPELIISQSQTLAGAPSAGDLGDMVYDSIGGDLFPGGGAPGISGAAAQPGIGMPQQLLPFERLSRIEEMFSEHIPLNVSTAIKQFGYEIFKPIEKEKEGREKEDNVSGESKGDLEGGELLKTLLGSKTRERLLAGEKKGIEGGFSPFATPTEIPVISDYILGPGDTLRISVWGQIQEVFPITIDSEGKVLIPKVGPLYLWGLKFIDAEKLIKENLSKVYTNIQISVSIERLRAIKVFVLGETQKPGAYVISALSNSFHALYAAGGPTKLGSMRNIKLIRKSKPERPIDLYHMLLKGDNSQDYKLQANDTIFIPPIGDVVGVAGNVKRPAIYELRDKIKLSDAIEMAAGLSSVGYLQRIQLERIQDHLRKVVLDLEFKSSADLKNSQNNLELQDGDLVLVFPITSVRHNFVSIAGNILRPGDYELKQGMRLKDLIDKAGGILPGTYLSRAEISRFRSDQTREVIPADLADLIDGKEEVNISLKEWDVVNVYAKKDVMQELFVEIDGAVAAPGRYELAENMKISDLIFRAGGLKRDALMSNGELYRSFTDSGPKIFNIDFSKVLSKDITESSKSDLNLEGGDHLFAREDTSKEEKTIITLSGEFKYPGKYAVEKGACLSEVIARAGGFTKNAFLDGCVYTRESVRIAQNRVIKNFLDSEQKALLQEQSSMAVGLTPVQAESRNRLIEYRQRLVEKLQGLNTPGRVLIRLNDNMRKFEKGEYNILVEDGDTLQIPTYPSTVQVVGNVYGAGTVAFNQGKGVDYYINKVGGLTKYADANRIFVIRANGETISSFVRAVKMKRGDVIVIPEEFKYRTLPGLFFKDIVQVIYQATLGAAVTISAINAL